jgi:hypothetical protein
MKSLLKGSDIGLIPQSSLSVMRGQKRVEDARERAIICDLRRRMSSIRRSLPEEAAGQRLECPLEPIPRLKNLGTATQTAHSLNFLDSLQYRGFEIGHGSSSFPSR